MSKYLDLLDNLSITHRLALIITAAFFVRLYVVFNAVMIPPDSVTYLRLASEFASGNYGEAFNVQRPPLYPFLISVSSYIFGDLEFSARIVSLVFGTLTIATAFLIGKTVYDERTGLITAFLVAIHPYLIRYSGDALTEGLYHFTFSIAVLASMKGAIERSPRWMIAAGFFVLLTYMTKPSGLGILFVTSLWVLLYKPFSIKADWGERLKLLLSGWLIFIILALPYLVFLFTQTGEVPVLGTARTTPMKLLITIASSFLSFDNIKVFAIHLPEAFTYGFFPLFIIFLLRRRKEGFKETELFLFAIAVAYFIIILGVLPDRRYMVQLMPVLLIFSAMGYIYFKEWVVRRKPTAAPMIVAVIILITTVAQVSHGMVPLQRIHLPERLAGEFIRDNFDAPVTIISRRPVVAHYAESEFVLLGKSYRSFSYELIKSRNIIILAGYSKYLPDTVRLIEENYGKVSIIKTIKTTKNRDYVIYRVSKSR